MGLLLVCVEQVSSSLPNNGGDGGGGTIARSALMHLAGPAPKNLLKGNGGGKGEQIQGQL
jgi:hypothetical protein